MRWIGIGLMGLAGGFTSGLLGVGGGVLFVPLLILFFHFDPHLAIGTSLAAIVPTALVGALRHFSGGWIDFRIAAVLALLAMVGAWLGSSVSLQMNAAVLRKVFALFLIAVAFRLFFE